MLVNLSLSIRAGWNASIDYVVEINAPRLEYLSIHDHRCGSFIIHNIGSSVKVDIDVIFNLESDWNPNDSSKIRIIDKFLNGLSIASNMIISLDTLEIIRDYCKMKMMPEFSNLSRLHADFPVALWDMLPSFLDSFPNLKFIIMEVFFSREAKHIDLSYVPQCFLSSLEFVQLETPHFSKMQEDRILQSPGSSSPIKIVKYFLENCAALKELTLDKSFFIIINEIKLIPRRSTICEVVVME